MGTAQPAAWTGCPPEPSHSGRLDGHRAVKAVSCVPGGAQRPELQKPDPHQGRPRSQTSILPGSEDSQSQPACAALEGG